LDGESVERVDPEETLYQPLALLCSIIVDVFKVTLFYFFEKFVLVFGAEGVVPLQHHVEEDTQRPHVGVDRTVVYFGDDFWGHVGRRATEGVDGVWSFAAEAEAEIDEFKLPVAVDEDVFGLDVSMDDVPFVEVDEGLCDDKQELLCFIFR
jgi:hypothetical protein